MTQGKRQALQAKHWFLILAPLVGFLLINSWAAALLEGVIYPRVSVNGENLAGLTRQQAYSRLQAKPLGQTLKITVAGKEFFATHNQVGARYDIAATVELAYQAGRDQQLPIIGLMNAGLKPTKLGYAHQIDYRRLSKFTNDVVTSVGQTAKNATIVVNDGQVQVVPDTPGIGLNRSTITKFLAGSMAKAEPASFELQPETVQAAIKADELEPVKTEVQQLLARSITLTYQDRQFVPTPVNIGYWVKAAPDSDVNPQRLVVQVDEQQVRGYVQSVANAINKNPISKKVLVKNGVSSVEREGTDGLAMDQEAATRAIMTAMQANTNQPFAYEINMKPVPFKTETFKTTSLDAAKYIEINLSRQYLWAYENGQIVMSSPITSGATGAGLPTVTGLFSIYYKARNTYLNGRPYGYNYNVFVQYWMPFYSGYGLHDASWRSAFGGSDYFYGGSHGCVNLPLSTAAFLYGWAEVGTPVWVHN